MWSFMGFLALALGWAIIIYGLWRNQRAAKGSKKVDKTNFGPRVSAIVEVVLHPDHAATWLIKDGRDNYKPVFPALGQDSSEQYGIREDDGRVT